MLGLLFWKMVKQVNGSLCTTVCLRETIAELQKQNLQRPIFNRHATVSACTAFQTTSYLEAVKNNLMNHCHYSSGFEHNEFSLFPFIKIKCVVTLFECQKMQLKPINRVFL